MNIQSIAIALKTIASGEGVQSVFANSDGACEITLTKAAFSKINTANCEVLPSIDLSEMRVKRLKIEPHTIVKTYVQRRGKK